MPRSPSVLPEGVRSTDFVSLGLMGKVYSKRLVRSVLKKTNTEGKRDRDLPDFLTFYYVLMLILYPKANYLEVMRLVRDGLQWLFGPHLDPVTATSAVTQARQRLGAQPFKEIYDQVVKPIATEKTRGAHYRRWKLHALDGTLVDVVDTKENREFFGKTSNQNSNEAGYPKLRAVSIVECGTHSLHATELGWFKKRNSVQVKQHPEWDHTARHSERYLAKQLLHEFQIGMLIFADRGFFSFNLWCDAASTGADLCWRIKDDVGVKVIKELSDGSCLVSIVREKKEIKCRLIEYEVKGGEERYRLLTTILDCRQAPAKELALQYHERWEIETTYKEMKIHLNLSRITLRSKVPELVHQEFWALLLSHFAVRTMMHEAALEVDEDPDNISFTHTVNVIRRNSPRFGAFSPEIIA